MANVSSAQRFRVHGVEAELSSLPRQRRCGFGAPDRRRLAANAVHPLRLPDCAAYARAVAAGEARHQPVPPAALTVIARLSVITGLPVVALNPEHGVESPRAVAFIDENWCIGCTLCIKACPTDAIVGANKLMHTVMESHCTGCRVVRAGVPGGLHSAGERHGLTRTGWAAWSAEQTDEARQRYAARTLRLERTAPEADEDVATLCDPEPASATHAAGCCSGGRRCATGPPRPPLPPPWSAPGNCGREAESSAKPATHAQRLELASAWGSCVPRLA